MASDSFTRNVEKSVRYWEKRVGQFQDVTRQMCAGFYPRTLSHVGRIPCIVKSICDQRDLFTGSPLDCLLRDQWDEEWLYYHLYNSHNGLLTRLLFRLINTIYSECYIMENYKQV